MSRFLHVPLVVGLILLGQTGDCAEDFRASSMLFTGTVEQVVAAVTNAFANGAYHGKRFVASPYDYVKENQRIVAVPVTNTWDLYNGALPLTLLRHGKGMEAYDETFQIKLETSAQGITRVSIMPGSSGTKEDRYELSMHLGRILGGRYIPPRPLETTNLFSRIQKQLDEIRAGRTNALPPTLDTRPGFFRDFWLNMSTDEKHDPRNWKKMVEAWETIQALQATTNSAGAVTNGVR